MPTSTQSIREIVVTQPSAAPILQRFEIDLCSQADASLHQACTELQLSVEQVLEKLTDAAMQDGGARLADPAALSQNRVIQRVVRIHHLCVRQELPRLAEMARRLVGKRGDRSPELKTIETLLEELHTDLINHIQREEMILFPFIAQMEEHLLHGGPPLQACFRSVAQPISMMMQEHESADRILAELRRLTRGFEPPDWACAIHVACFAGLIAFVADLNQHVHLENNVLFPRAVEMETRLHPRV
jgi:regulator of cell morphogenesis and NO signaling